MKKITIEADSREAFLKALEEVKKKFDETKGMPDDFSEEGCVCDCENCENFVSEEEIISLKGKVLAYGATINTLLTEKELIPISVVDEYNATLIDLQDYLDDEDEDDGDEDS